MAVEDYSNFCIYCKGTEPAVKASRLVAKKLNARSSENSVCCRAESVASSTTNHNDDTAADSDDSMVIVGSVSLNRGPGCKKERDRRTRQRTTITEAPKLTVREDCDRLNTENPRFVAAYDVVKGAGFPSMGHVPYIGGNYTNQHARIMYAWIPHKADPMGTKKIWHHSSSNAFIYATTLAMDDGKSIIRFVKAAGVPFKECLLQQKSTDGKSVEVADIHRTACACALSYDLAYQ